MPEYMQVFKSRHLPTPRTSSPGSMRILLARSGSSPTAPPNNTKDVLCLPCTALRTGHVARGTEELLTMS